MSICIKHLPVLLSQALIFNMTDTCVPFSLHHDTLSSKKRYLSHTAAILARSLWCFSIICNWLYIGTFQCLLLLQKVQNAAPGLVCNKHWKIDHILKLNWLLVKGRISMNTAGLACKGLHDQNFPYQLKLLWFKSTRKQERIPGKQYRIWKSTIFESDCPNVSDNLLRHIRSEISFSTFKDK